MSLLKLTMRKEGHPYNLGVTGEPSRGPADWLNSLFWDAPLSVDLFMESPCGRDTGVPDFEKCSLTCPKP